MANTTEPALEIDPRRAQAGSEMGEKFVVATDGGPASQSALTWIANRARRHPIEVEIVAVENLGWLPLGADRSEYLHTYEALLEAAQARLETASGVEFVTTRLLVGDPAEELLNAAAMAGSLVIGSSRNPDSTGAQHGTLALRVAAQSSTRLVVVPAGWEPRPGRIIVGISEDESSDAALDAAISEAIHSRAELLLVHAWSLPAPFSLIDGLWKQNYPTLETLHQRILDQAASRAGSTENAPALSTVLRYGHPAAVLVDIAKGEALLVVGDHHHNPFSSLLLGSVSHDVLLAAVTPVMVEPASATTTHA